MGENQVAGAVDGGRGTGRLAAPGDGLGGVAARRLERGACRRGAVEAPSRLRGASARRARGLAGPVSAEGDGAEDGAGDADNGDRSAAAAAAVVEGRWAAGSGAAGDEVCEAATCSVAGRGAGSGLGATGGEGSGRDACKNKGCDEACWLRLLWCLGSPPCALSAATGWLPPAKPSWSSATPKKSAEASPTASDILKRHVDDAFSFLFFVSVLFFFLLPPVCCVKCAFRAPPCT